MITSSATPSVAENTTSVVNLTATDADLPSQTVSFSITGGADAAKFQIVGNELRFVAAPDYEAPADADTNNVYLVQVTANDGAGRTAVQNLSVTVTPVNDNDPVITSSATPSVAENTTGVVNLTATDADLPGQTVSFSITGGADAAQFQIVGGQLRFSSAPDYEAPTDADANNVYQVQVTANDGAGRTAVQNLSVTVTPVNDNDPGDHLERHAVGRREHDQRGEPHGDGCGPAGPDGQLLDHGRRRRGRFQIVGGQLQFVAAPDYEAPSDADANNVYQVQVTANDGAGRTAVQNLSVTVTPVNDNDPVITSSATPSVAENTTSVVNLTATDADLPAQSLSFAITGGADAARFAIVAGQLQFQAAPDFEAPTDANADNVYEVQVTVSDGAGRSTIQNLSVTVTDVAEFGVGPISDADGAADEVAENSSAGTPVGITAFADDPDVGETVSYSLLDDAGGRFAIDANTGVVTVAGGAILDREATASHTITVRATSTDSSFTTRNFTIAITPVNDNDPVITSSATPSVPENTTSVVNLTATDADLPGQTVDVLDHRWCGCGQVPDRGRPVTVRLGPGLRSADGRRCQQRLPGPGHGR